MVIGEDGKKLGIMDIYRAVESAQEKRLDLVEVSPLLVPPVCKIMDYGKYLYVLTKQKRQQSAKQKKIDTKGIRLTVRTDKHDLEFKARNAVKFMKKGHKARIDLVLKGREKSHMNLAKEKLEKFIQTIFEISKADPETTNKEIIKEVDAKKTPQGFTSIIEYKRG